MARTTAESENYLGEITEITGSITDIHGRVTQFTITPEGYQNYGAETRVLGTRVDALSTMTETLSTEDVFEPSFGRDVCKHCSEPISYYPGEHQWLHDDAGDADDARYCQEG